MDRVTDRLLGELLSQRFDAFGCPQRGLHVDNQERTGCLACNVETGKYQGHGADDSVALDDDRLGVLHMPLGQPWPHTRFFKPGVGLHRGGGEPAIDSAEVRGWFVDGVCHREGAPALEWGEGYWAWFQHGKIHRVGGPALNWEETEDWWTDGRLHREDGPARFIKPAARNRPWIYRGRSHEYALDGHLSSRQEVWARWVASHTPFAADNKEAMEFLDAGTNGSDAGDAPFAPLEPELIKLALLLHDDFNVSPRQDAHPGSSVDTSPGLVDVQPPSTPDPASPLSPHRLLPAAQNRRDIAYDAVTFRRRIAEAHRLGKLKIHDSDARGRWTKAHDLHGLLSHKSYVAADLEIDKDMIAVGLRIQDTHLVLDPHAIMKQIANGEPLSHVARRYWHADRSYEYAGQLLSAFAQSGGFPTLPGRPAPLPSIECPIERAFEFAGQAIASGVDDIVARTWATAMVVAHGYDVIPLTWHGESPSMGVRTVRPARTLASAYYAQAIEDLKERSDGSRFMNLVSKIYRYPSWPPLTDG